MTTALLMNRIDGQGNLATESVWLSAAHDIPDLSAYLLCDSTYTEDKQPSNELRHLFWFPKCPIRQGDIVRVMTREGIETHVTNDTGTTTHTFYWQLGRSIWNKQGDVALLFQLAECQTMKI